MSNRSGRKNPWLVALVSWAGAVAAVTIVYGIWLLSQGKPMRWDLIGEAALIVAPLALIKAWRDRN